MNQFEKTFTFGKIDYNWRKRRVNAVSAEFHLTWHPGRKQTIDGDFREGYLSFGATGSIWNQGRSDTISGGQNLEEINKYADVLQFDREAWPTLYKLWREWHLNDLTAGTREQMAHLAEAKAGHMATFENAGYKVETGSTYGYLSKENDTLDYGTGMPFYAYFGFGSYYDWQTAMLKSAGILTVPFGEPVENGNGAMVQPTYTFGHNWLLKPLTVEALADVSSILTDTERVCLADFLREVGIVHKVPVSA